jgi:hypothetical protein
MLNKATELALKTWYSPGHSLHMGFHHPLGKLLGELGELLDDYMKSIYKPGYIFNPVDELGDIWYYLRILAYQNNHELKELGFNVRVATDIAIALVMIDVANAFVEKHMANIKLDVIYTVLVGIAARYEITIDDLTHFNWEKLKPGSIRGDEWMEARPRHG